MNLVGTGVLHAVVAAGLVALGWTCVPSSAGMPADAAVIVHEGGALPKDLVVECAARSIPTVVIGSIRRPADLLAAVRAGATSVVDQDLPILDLLTAVQRGLSPSGVRTAQRDALLAGLRGRLRLRDRLDQLTPREQVVLAELATGRSAAEIARREHVSLTTVRSHIRSILLKLDVSSQLAAVAAGRRGRRELNLSDHVV